MVETQYKKLLEDESQQSDDGIGQLYQRRNRYRVGALTVLWFISLGIVWAAARWHYLHSPHIETVAAVDYNSPLYGRLKPRLENVTPDRSAFDDGSIIYRGDPSPEVDDAWAKLIHWNPVLVDEADLKHLGMPTKGAVKYKGQYPMKMDIFHLMHCLNELRKAAWFDYYERNETLNPAYYVHIRHCLDVLRQEIMCTGSMNMYRIVWSDHQEVPWPEFTVHRQCRSYDDIVDWYKENRVSDEEVDAIWKLRRQPGEYAEPMPLAGIKLVEEVKAWHEKWANQIE